LSPPPATHPHDQAQRGVWTEYEGDFRMLGDLPEANEVYERASEIYEDAGDPESVGIEQFFMSVTVLPELLARGTDTSIGEFESAARPAATLTEWIQFKREQMPVLLEQLDDADEWTYVF
jgi:hypothetical protein